jgi:hypothetical protein
MARARLVTNKLSELERTGALATLGHIWLTKRCRQNLGADSGASGETEHPGRGKGALANLLMTASRETDAIY